MTSANYYAIGTFTKQNVRSTAMLNVRILQRLTSLQVCLNYQFFDKMHSVNISFILISTTSFGSSSTTLEPVTQSTSTKTGSPSSTTLTTATILNGTTMVEGYQNAYFCRLSDSYLNNNYSIIPDIYL